MNHTKELIERAHRGDEKARETLVLENMGLIGSIVRRFAGRGYEQVVDATNTSRPVAASEKIMAGELSPVSGSAPGAFVEVVLFSAGVGSSIRSH